MSKIRPIAIHLPQFHPFAENDEWWGKGFTEWTNVTKALPQFEGHYQPHLPADLGFYDLRLEECRLAQEALAKKYDIYGFCYYHYWFNGKRLMHEPVDRKIKNPKEDLPFMLCWANENWTRAWDGAEKQILIKQEYSLEDDEKHIRFLFDNIFNDSRYIRIEGKIFFAVYRPIHFPNIEETVKLWRKIATEYGEELHLVYMRHFTTDAIDLDAIFDASIDFQPDFRHTPKKEEPTFKDRWKLLTLNKRNYIFDNNIVKYSDFVNNQKSNQVFSDHIYPGITPMWDNSARRKIAALTIDGSTPELYEGWLNFIIDQYKKVDQKTEKFVFINAWNEWAEGNHLEPCQKWGRSYLEATKKAFEKQ
ncbi:glycoside hydrolase family 99-like domain-containing protein [Chryseobacterium sp.]|uniref:glycosyltransferase WbsX family protein n=1 Tax=Chryseobacterium sp. TaxID=1871047 RepID=UPI0028A20455|nr:glycoside hydrolase family 99-like domain-containing protein [Chryseobacterium sp.]